MPHITFITPSGETVQVDQEEGSLMEAAVNHGVDGIDADCGGVCSCATCHVHVHPDWQARVGPASSAEQALFELEDKAHERSRLACQIKLNASLDGLIVHVVGR
jgi:ferredoxin, 2Fe-2S